jgi:glycosyltransferase involved in cell wall biosynthesis
MTKIAFVTNAPPFSGMGKPAREVFSRLRENNIDSDFFYLDASHGEILKNDEKIVGLRDLPRPLGVKPVQWWRLARKLPKQGYDFWHIGNQTLSFIPRQNFLLTVYDLIELVDPQEMFGSFVAKYLYKGISRAKHIICVSEYTKKVLQKVYHIPGEKITVIPLAVGEHFKPLENIRQSIGYQEFLSLNNLPNNAKIILHVGSDHPRKNLNLLAEILARVKKSVPNVYLIKVGAPGLKAGRLEFQNKLSDLKVSDAVRFIDNTTDEKLAMIYAMADVFIFPSLYEGFGVPPLEAMACGCPVVASNATSIPEVIGDASPMHDPTDIVGFTASVQRVLNDANYAAELKQKGIERTKFFSWDEIAKKTAEVYESMLYAV